MKTVEDILIHDVMTGGNHLASALLGLGCYPSQYASYQEVLGLFDQPAADMWVAWRAIRNWAEYQRSK